MSNASDRLVPLSALIQFARLGVRMRNAQRAFFKKRREQPHVPAEAELIAARDAERAFDSAAADVLARERESLPGMGDD